MVRIRKSLISVTNLYRFLHDSNQHRSLGSTSHSHPLLWWWQHRPRNSHRRRPVPSQLRKGGGGRERFICGLSFDNYHTPKGRENKAREVTRIVWFVLGRISFVKMRWKQRAKVMTIYYILFQTLNLYYKYFMYWYLLIYLYIVIFSNYHLTCLRYRSWRHIRALSTLPCPSFVSKENFEDLG